MATGRKRRASGIRDLLSDLAEFESTPESRGYDLRLDLAEIILRHLDGRRWTQGKLARAAGMKSSFLTRITHAAQNCTFEVAGRLLFALGVNAKLVEGPQTFVETTIVANIGAQYAETEAAEIQTDPARTDSATSYRVRSA